VLKQPRYLQTYIENYKSNFIKKKNKINDINIKNKKKKLNEKKYKI